MDDLLEIVSKSVLAIFALLGGKSIIEKLVVIFNKKECHNKVSAIFGESVGRDKLIINNYNYNFPGIGNPEDLMFSDHESESDRKDFYSPVKLTDEQEELCKRLDLWHKRYGLPTKPSDMFRGALFVTQSMLRQNPDWIAQAAHSLRDILYPFGSVAPNKAQALKQYGSVFGTDKDFIDEFGRIYGTLTELSHHSNGRGNSVDFSTFKPTDFDKIVADFERIMRDALLRQLDIHSEIDAMLDGVISAEKPE